MPFCKLLPALTLVLVLGVAPAAAQVHKVAVVAVPLDPALGGEAALATFALESAVGGDARAIAVSLLDRARAGADERPAKASQAAKLLPEAVDAFDGMEFATAVAKARQVVALLEAADLRESMPALLDALAVESLALLASGKKLDARGSINKVLTLKPDYKWSASRLTPDASRAIDEVRVKLRSRAKGVLEIKTSTPALVYLDGVLKGPSPVMVPDLIAGSHYVTAVAIGYSLAQDKGFAGPGASVSLALSPLARGQELLTLLAALREGLAGGVPGEAAGALARWAGAEEVLAFGLSGAGPRPKAVAARVDRQGHLIAKAEKTLAGKGDAARGDLATVVRELLAVESPRTAEPVAGAQTTSPATQSASVNAKVVAGWTLAGVGVASAASALGLGLNVRSIAAQARATPQADKATYDSLVSSGKARGFATDALWVVAAASAAAGAVLLVMAYRTPSGLEASATLSPTSRGAALTVQGRF